MKNLLLTILILSPLSAFASGGDVLSLLYYELLTIIAVTIFIFCIKWKVDGKLLLAIVLIVSEFLTFMFTGRMPYGDNKTLIDTLHVGIPLVSNVVAYFIFRRRFALKKRNRG